MPSPQKLQVNGGFHLLMPGACPRLNPWRMPCLQFGNDLNGYPIIEIGAVVQLVLRIDRIGRITRLGYIGVQCPIPTFPLT
jgi:hypothetical protein